MIAQALQIVQKMNMEKTASVDLNLLGRTSMFRLPNILLCLIVFGTTLTVCGQKMLTDTVNTTTPGVHRVISHQYPYKGKKLQLKKGSKIGEEVYHPNGVIQERTLNDVLYVHDEHGRPIKATFQVPELLNGNFTKFWQWDYEFDDKGQVKYYSISRSKYGKTYEVFRYDSVINGSNTQLDVTTTRSTYHRMFPFIDAPLRSETHFLHGKITEHWDASTSPPGSYISRKYGYDMEGHLIEMQLYDEGNALVYLEQFSYEQGKRVLKLTEADGETTKTSYSYNGEGQLEREILYGPAGKPYAAIMYSYELY
jgi:hypothetical protein